MSSKRASIFWLVFALCAITISIGNLIWLYSQHQSINHGDEILLVHFFLIELAHVENLVQFFDALWWTYLQHRMISYKLIVWLFSLLPNAYFWPCYLIGALLIQLAWVYLLAKFIQPELPHQPVITQSLSMLWLLAPYAYITIITLGMQYTYTLSTLLSLSALYCLTQKNPKILLGVSLMGIATLTFSNGLLVTGIGWALLAYRLWVTKDIKPQTLLLWSYFSAVLAALYLSSTNVFSSDFYGAKSPDIVLQHIPSAVIGLLDGLGTIPLPTTHAQWLRVLWGGIYLFIILLLLWRERYKLPLMLVAALGFSIASLFTGALFRHSAAQNSAYLYLTSLVQLLTLLWLLRLWPSTWLKLFAAAFSIFIFANAVYLNTIPYQKEVRWVKLKTQKLLSEQPDYDSVQKALFDELRYVKGITPFNKQKLFNAKLSPAPCPQITAQWGGGTIVHNYPDGQAVKIIHRNLDSESRIYLCSHSASWEVQPLDKDYAMLIDKVNLPPETWTLVAQTSQQVVQLAPSFNTNKTLSLSNAEREKQCGAIKEFAAVTPLTRVTDYFCNRPLR